MAADIINTVLKAESTATAEEAKAEKQAEQIVLDAKARASVIVEDALEKARLRADEIVSEAEQSAQGIISQAQTLAKLRERKVISDVEKKYDEAIKMIIENVI